MEERDNHHARVSRSDVTASPGQSLAVYLIEQGWVAFLFLGLFMVGLRFYNMRQRRAQSTLLRESLMVELERRRRNQILLRKQAMSTASSAAVKKTD